jgi:hypothetical protein
MIDSKIARISDICGGKADDDFAGALREVVQNMGDPKCDSKAVRRITLDVSFRQDPRNGMVDVGLDMTVKLAKQGGRRSLAYIGKGNDGQMGLFMDDPDQANMFNQLENTSSEVAK